MTDMSRREWLRSRVPALVEAVAESVAVRVERSAPPQRRPPGAVVEASFLALCTRCGDCAEACPHDAVHTYGDDAGFVAGTPVMLPDQRSCHMCDGYPCVAACEEGALNLFDEPTWWLGEARIVESQCIAFAGPDCGACADRCPKDVEALEMVRGKPRIVSEACVGCGLCIEACPTLPAAIELLPLPLEASR